MRELRNTPSKTRLIIATVLLILSVAISISFSIASRSGEDFWVARSAILPGTSIDQNSIERVTLSLGDRASLYFRANQSPASLTSKRFFAPGEIISRSGTTQQSQAELTVLAPLSIRSVDIPENTNAGDTVSLYWVLDSRTEELFEPEEIARDIFINSINRRGSNFGSDLAVTVSISQSQVQKLLSYTSGGRIVVVPSHG